MNKFEKARKVAELKSTLQRLNDTFDRGECTRETFNEYTILCDDAIDHRSWRPIDSKLFDRIQESPVYELIDLFDNNFLSRSEDDLLADDDFCETLWYIYDGEACDCYPGKKWAMTMQKNIESLGFGDALFEFWRYKVVPHQAEAKGWY